jgi:tellurite resistance protein
MGLFDRISTATGGGMLNPAEAVAAITLLSVASDGYLSDDEIQTLWATLSRMQLFKSYSGDVVRRMFDKLAGILKRQGRDSLLQLAKSSLPYEMGATVFAICTDLIMSDGTVEPEEEAFLERLHQLLEVPQETALQIIQVMIIKNKG